MIKQINIKELDEKIEDLSSHINSVKRWIQDEFTTVKQEYLKELQIKIRELINFKHLVEKYEQPQVVQTENIEDKSSPRVIEVEVNARYRDGGSDDVTDAEGNKYHIPIGYKMWLKNGKKRHHMWNHEMPYHGHYVGPDVKKVYVDENVEFKIVRDYV